MRSGPPTASCLSYLSAEHLFDHRYCAHCHLLKQACVCEKIPRLALPFTLSLIVHPKERLRKNNTGHLLYQALFPARFCVWQRGQLPFLCDDTKAKAEGSTEPQRQFLMFPPHEGEPPGEQVTLDKLSGADIVMLDGTWQECRKMLRQTPALQALPKLHLQPTLSRRYHLRRNSPADTLCTFEAFVQLTSNVGLNPMTQKLNEYFVTYLKHFQASQSGHGIHTGEIE